MATSVVHSQGNLFQRSAVLVYGVACYVMFLGVFLYSAGFVGGFVTPTQLDGPASAPLMEAVVVNSLLVLLFGLQHSVMARPGFKQWWTKLVPVPVERSTYVLATNLVMGLMFWQWRPMGGVVWNVQSPVGQFVLWTLFAIGWLCVLITTWLINHFDLFGLRQTWLYFRGRSYEPLTFVMPGPYRLIRHPLYFGWLMAFWATPTMTAAHFLFAAGMTAYILIAIQYEERDLIASHQGYAEYRRQVPMLIPRLKSFDDRAQESIGACPIEYSLSQLNLTASKDRS